MTAKDAREAQIDKFIEGGLESVRNAYQVEGLAEALAAMKRFTKILEGERETFAEFDAKYRA